MIDKRRNRTPQGALSKKIEDGKAVPLISSGVDHDLILWGHKELVKYYAKQTEYPLASTHDLSHIAQVYSVTHSTDSYVMRQDYLDIVKDRLREIAEADGVPQEIQTDAKAGSARLGFTEMAKVLGYPSFDNDLPNSLLLLARLNLPLYLTTSYHTFLEAALVYAGKKPRTEFCRWNQRLEPSSRECVSDYQPSSEEPLVYHLFGLDTQPESLVLTEDDYLDFLVNLTLDMSQKTDRIPRCIRRALADSSLILLGYDLRSWEFRTLFWGLIRNRPLSKQENVSVQVAPDDPEKCYLDKYLSEASFRVVWGEVHQYIQELCQSMGT